MDAFVRVMVLMSLAVVVFLSGCVYSFPWDVATTTTTITSTTTTTVPAGCTYYRTATKSVLLCDHVTDAMFDRYVADYPNETAFCLTYAVDDFDALVVVDVIDPVYKVNDDGSVSFLCSEGMLYGHSHTIYENVGGTCRPTFQDKESIPAGSLGVIVCGDGYPLEVYFFDGRG